jgi:hypothetical protein
VLLEFAELLDGNAGQLPRSPFVGAGPADTSANTVRQSLASQYLDGKFNNMTVEIEQKAGRDVVAAWKQTQEALQRVTSVEAEIYRIVDVGDGANKRSVRVRVMGLPQ